MRKFFLLIFSLIFIFPPNLNSMEVDEFAENLARLKISNSNKTYNPKSLFDICAEKIALNFFDKDFFIDIFSDSHFLGLRALWELHKDIIITYVFKKNPEVLKPICIYESCRVGKYAITSVISQDEKYFAFGWNDGIVNLYEMKSGKFLGNFKHDESIHALFISECGNYLVAGSENQVTIWNLKTGAHLKKLEHLGWIRAVVMSTCGNFVVSGTSGAGHGNDTVKVWDWKLGRCLKRIIIKDSGGLENVAISGCGKYISVSLHKKQVTYRQTRNVIFVFDCVSGKRLNSCPANVKWIYSRDITKNGMIEKAIFGDPHAIRILHRTWYEALSFEGFLLVIKLQMQLNKNKPVVLSQNWRDAFDSLPQFLKDRFKSIVLPI